MVEKGTHTTPVDTSQALSNWVAGLGSVDPSFIGPWVPGIGGSTKAASARAAIAIARLIIADKKPGQPVFISNSAPYIEGLENETISRQPGRFVARMLIVGRAVLKKDTGHGN